MQVPLTVSFRGIDVDDVIRDACWAEAEKLERFYERITSCHVTVGRAMRRRKGNGFALHVRLALPGGTIVVDHPVHESPGPAVRVAFDEVRRQLQDFAQRQRGEEKRHAES
ncbi:MAG: HPF/RaiA family ribosome-associated protein [Planctomycetota bacterium]